LGRLTHSPARLALLLRWLADSDRALVAIENELDTSTMAGRKTAEALIEVGDWDREFAQRRAHKQAEARGEAAGGNKRPTARAGYTGFTLPEPPSAGAAEEVEG
jgi:DNA invertase Pin-like site-specific DNA recombinase